VNDRYDDADWGCHADANEDSNTTHKSVKIQLFGAVAGINMMVFTEQIIVFLVVLMLLRTAAAIDTCSVFVGHNDNENARFRI
jgi:hypothetical protein